MSSEAKGLTLASHLCIQHSRCTEQDDWLLWDLSLSLNGNIAVTCYNKNTYRTSIDVYSVRHSESRDKPKIFYFKEFEKYESGGWRFWLRLVSFVKLDINGDNIGLVTSIGDELQVIDLIQDRVLKSCKVTLGSNGGIDCLSVSERQIFIGFWKSNQITVYNVIKLTKIKSIILQGVRDNENPFDMKAIVDRIFVCVGVPDKESKYRSLIFKETNGRMLSELAKTEGTNWYAGSITVSVPLGVVAVAWVDSPTYKRNMHRQIQFYSLLSANYSSFLIFEFESGVTRIRISDSGDRMVTRNRRTGEMKMYDMAELFTYGNLKEHLASQLERQDCVKLARFFSLSKDQTDIINKTSAPAEILLRALEDEGVVQEYNVGRLTEAFNKLRLRSSCTHVTDIYQKTRRSSFVNETISDLTQSFKVMNSQFRTSLDRPETVDSIAESQRWADKISRINAEVDTLKSVGSIKYSKKEKVGTGSSGSHIFCGKFGNRDVAVKKIVSENVQKESQLYELMKTKPMNNILKILHIEEDDDFTYVATKLCEYDLKAVIEDDTNPVGGNLTQEKRLNLCVDILRGIKDLHSVDVIHRDLKPSNILIDVNGDAFVADFGISRNLIGETTQVTSSYGTLCWIAHESSQAKNDKVKYKKESDVQVAGCLIYYILSNGHHPFEATSPFINNTAKLMTNVAEGKFSLVHVKTYPAKCTALLQRMLDQDMLKRPTIDVCLEDMEAIRKSNTSSMKENTSTNDDGESSATVLQHDTAYLSESLIAETFSKLVVKVSLELTRGHCVLLASYFNFPAAKIAMIGEESTTPGLDLLETMKERNIINMYDVINLQQALADLKLYKINETLVTPYHRNIDPRLYEEHKIWTKEL